MMNRSNSNQKHQKQTKSKHRFDQEQSEHIIFVDLPAEPQMSDKLETILKIARGKVNHDIAIDFSKIDIVTCSSISKLLKLRKLLTDCEHKLILCNVSKVTEEIFINTGLEGLFELSDRKGSFDITVKDYLSQIDESVVLTPEQGSSLDKQIIEKNGTDAREQLILSNLKQVVIIAKKYTDKGMSLGDLIEEGNLGLIRAVDSFDPEHGVRFSTYAAWWIKQSIKRALLEQGFSLPDTHSAKLEKTNLEDAILEKTMPDDSNILSKAKKSSKILEGEIDGGETCEGHALAFEIEVPANVTDDDVKSTILELVGQADSFYRLVGGHGLKFSDLSISELVPPDKGVGQ